MIGFLLPHLFSNVPADILHISALLFYSILSLLPIGSSFWFFYQTISLFLSALLLSYTGGYSFSTFAIGSLQAILFGTEAYWSILEIFVPLTGRLGIDSPAENVIAIIVTLITFQSWPLLPSYIATLSRKTRIRALFTMAGAVMFGVVFFTTRDVWDAAHPRRLFIEYIYNITDSTTSLHFASADPAPGFKDYLTDLATRLDLGTPEENTMTDWLSDWDTIYPFSQFLNSYRIQLPTPAIQELPDSYEEPRITGTVLSSSAMGEDSRRRQVTLQLDSYHPGLMWTVISFDAEILSWTLPMPDPGFRRHHIKQVSTYNSPAHSMTLTLALDHINQTTTETTAGAADDDDHSQLQTTGPLWIDFVGIEEFGMYPAMKDNVDAMTRDSMRLFERLEGPGGIGHAVDACSGAVIAGRFRIDL